MTPIDWQELYAANQAAIHGARGSGPTPPALPDVPQLPARHELRSRLRPPLAPASPAAGGMERLEGSRPAYLHVPRGLTPGTAVPLLVMLHGCTQDAASFAHATRMNAAADRHGFAVLYPEQTRQVNPQGCWNWFAAEHQARGAGEPAAIATTARAVLAEGTRWTIDPARVFVAGLSAGGAMAAVMAATHPDLFAGVAVHSGLAYGAATTMPAAFAAMSGGEPDPARSERAALAAMGTHRRAVPALVIHGTADATVSPVNGDQVAAQWLATNRAADPAAAVAALGAPSERSTGRMDGGYAHTRRRWLSAGGALVLEYLVVEGLGHAWSGGVPGGSYTDPRGVSATEAICDFLARVGEDGPRPA
jgi:poly(hydroxyalkanoate) depolymerase family esterase